jgi:hypothetical protein
MKATYVSVWDGGTEIRTSCEYDVNTHILSDIETVDVNGLDLLDEEFIELPDGTKITDWINEDEVEIVAEQNKTVNLEVKISGSGNNKQIAMSLREMAKSFENPDFNTPLSGVCHGTFEDEILCCEYHEY